MGIFDLVDGLLKELKINFYEGQPEFARSPPDEFITYSLYDKPQFYGCGIEQITRYYITFNIYTTGSGCKTRADRINADLTALLSENGFVRNGGSCRTMNDFPRYYHRITEFIYDYSL